MVLDGGSRLLGEETAMRAVWLPDKLTVLSPREAIDALRSAYETIEGVTPTPQCLCIHVAQSMGESGRFRSCHNYSFSNPKAGEQYEGFYQNYRCDEKIDGVWRRFVPQGELTGGWDSPIKGQVYSVPEGHPQTRFRAFRNAGGGAIDHLLLQKRRYPEAYAAAKLGDVRAHVEGLKARGFFTADFEPYLKMESGLYREFLPLCVDMTRDTIAPPPEDDHETLCAGMACVAPDPERALHTEAVVAWMLGQEGMWDAVREERNRNLADE